MNRQVDSFNESRPNRSTQMSSQEFISNFSEKRINDFQLHKPCATKSFKKQ